MWKIKDWFVNAGLAIRLWFYVTFNSKRFNNVINDLEKEGWELTFNDEFDEGEVNREKWRTDAYYGLRYHPGDIIEKGTAPVCYYDDNCFEFNGSVMSQLAKDEPTEIEYIDWDGKNLGKYTIPYKIGQLDSSNYFSQKYGYWEIRSKMPNEPGNWSAFWMVSTDNYPPEIDVYEVYTGKKRGMKGFDSNFHWRKKKGARTGDKLMNPKTHRVLDISKGFHNYAVEWSEKSFKVYYDNMLVRRYTNPDTLAFFEYPMHIIVSTGIHPDQHPDKANYPNAHEVDYIRVYKKK